MIISSRPSQRFRKRYTIPADARAGFEGSDEVEHLPELQLKGLAH
jgi:hypothetical protein